MSRINTNIAALNALRNLNTTNTGLSRSLERLSSGFRITRAADDPAGLTISEQLRAQLAALREAVNNSQRASNLVRTAEGALNEVNALLVNVKELVLEAANDGALSQEEIDANQAQVDSAIESINRIANTTKFAGKYLLNGLQDYVVSGAAASISELNIQGAFIPAGQTSLAVNLKVTANAQRAIVQKDNIAGTSAGSAISLEITGNKGTEVVILGASSTLSQIVAAVNNVKDSTGVSAVRSTDIINSGISFVSTEFGSAQFVQVNDLDTDGNLTRFLSNSRDTGTNVTALINGQTAASRGLTLSLNTTLLDLQLTLSSTFGTGATTAAPRTDRFDIMSGGLTFQLGDTTQANEKQAIGLQQINPAHLGKGGVGFLNQLMTGSAFNLTTDPDNASKIVDEAIRDVTLLRSRLGAFEKNTLDTNINSLGVAIENLSAAESRIRDTDFAAETTEFTRLQILAQAGTAILAQSNLVPQSVLQLLG
ncbi:MAG: flagellin [Planctomycetes bacterium]|nr:flagellin [Planctomycetota bacterium]